MATGRWSAARWRPDSSLRSSNWRRRIGSLQTLNDSDLGIGWSFSRSRPHSFRPMATGHGAGASSISHQIEPAIPHFGTPVVLIGSTNGYGSFNLAPTSVGMVGRMALHARPRAQFQDDRDRHSHGGARVNCRLPHSSTCSIGWRDPRLRSGAGLQDDARLPARIQKFGLCGLTAKWGETVAYSARWTPRFKSRPRSRTSKRWRRRRRSGAAISRRLRCASPAYTLIPES